MKNMFSFSKGPQSVHQIEERSLLGLSHITETTISNNTEIYDSLTRAETL